MKYFTIEWWSGEVEDDSHLFGEYRKHVEGIFGDLPPDHQRLDREISLHDAHLLNLDVDLRSATLTLDLDGYGFDEESKSYFGRRFCLRYTNVESFRTTANPEKGLPGPHGFGDLGYYEIYMPEPGLFEHRMLFSTGIVIAVLHRGFSLTYTDYKQEAEQGGGGNSAALRASDWTFGDITRFPTT